MLFGDAMKLRPTHWIIALIVAVILSTNLCAKEQQKQTTKPSGALAYLHLIEQGLAQTRANLPHITASAEQASKNLLAGGNIWAGGRQAGFDREATGRAGGLMSMRLLGKSTPVAGDIVLYAVPGALNHNDLQKIKAWQSQGIYVVAFASKTRTDPKVPPPAWMIENLPRPGLAVRISGQPKLIPADTVLNVINLWVWTGELAAACTRSGKMPVCYKSYGLPGGMERARKYMNRVFHDDFKIHPIKAGLIGKAYLKVIKSSLRYLRRQQIRKIHRAAKWWLATPTKDVSVLHIAHLFPEHLQDPRTPQLYNQIACNIGPQPLGQTPRPQMLVISLSYQQAPKAIIDQAKTSGMKFIYSSVRHPSPAEPADNIIYLKPNWTLPDACVKVPGYDVDILPASGALNAVIYWSILADTAKLNHARSPPTDNPKPTNAHEQQE